MSAAAETAPAPAGPTPMQEYMFDLVGYTQLPGVLSAQELASMNAWLDAHASGTDGLGEWIGPSGRIESHSYYHDGRIDDGINLQHMFEEPEFEPLVDHSGWMGHVDHYVRGPAIHEMFVNLRGPGGYIGCHCVSAAAPSASSVAQRSGCTGRARGHGLRPDVQLRHHRRALGRAVHEPHHRVARYRPRRRRNRAVRSPALAAAAVESAG